MVLIPIFLGLSTAIFIHSITSSSLRKNLIRNSSKPAIPLFLVITATILSVFLIKTYGGGQGDLGTKVCETVVKKVAEAYVSKFLGYIGICGMLLMNWFSTEESIYTTVDGKGICGKIESFDCFGIQFRIHGERGVSIPHGMFTGCVSKVANMTGFKLETDFVVNLDDYRLVYRRRKIIIENVKAKQELLDGYTQIYVKGIDTEKLKAVIHVCFVLQTNVEEDFLEVKKKRHKTNSWDLGVGGFLENHATNERASVSQNMEKVKQEKR
ncbi:hypothetical protein C5167_009908, partial [Papaver somniferum]